MRLCGYPAIAGYLEPAASGSFRTLWGTSWDTCCRYVCKLRLGKSFTGSVVLTWPERLAP